MKLKTLLFASAILLCGCSNFSLDSIDQSTTKGKLKACAAQEAYNKVQDGTAFTKGVSETADEISNTCLKKLALQAAGLDTEATKDATNALQNLMNVYNSSTAK